mmetsp:Transcript_47646/g.113196  ORF Transcript_47646/g.113196 Transcript_47646/m.113196 type:complete len:352 (+) Transcript_47646:1630-2685(+)
MKLPAILRRKRDDLLNLLESDHGLIRPKLLHPHCTEFVKGLHQPSSTTLSTQRDNARDHKVSLVYFVVLEVDPHEVQCNTQISRLQQNLVKILVRQLARKRGGLLAAAESNIEYRVLLSVAASGTAATSRGRCLRSHCTTNLVRWPSAILFSSLGRGARAAGGRSRQLSGKLRLQFRNKLRIPDFAALELNIAPDVPHDCLAFLRHGRSMREELPLLDPRHHLQNIGRGSEPGGLEVLPNCFANTGLLASRRRSSTVRLGKQPVCLSPQPLGAFEGIGEAQGQASLSLKLGDKNLVRGIQVCQCRRIFATIGLWCQVPAHTIKDHASVLFAWSSKAPRLVSWMCFCAVILQ